MKIKTIIILAIIALISILIVVKISPQPQKPIGVISKVNVGGQELLYEINQDNIYFYPFENTQPLNFARVNIEKKDYPKLFKQGIANYSSIIIEEYKNPQDKKAYIQISNVQPDHGAYATQYRLLIDPHTGNIEVKK